MEVLALEFSGIVKLDISGCSRITDEAMDSFARHSENMRWLKLSNCPQISEIVPEAPNLGSVERAGRKRFFKHGSVGVTA